MAVLHHDPGEVDVELMDQPRLGDDPLVKLAVECPLRPGVQLAHVLERLLAVLDVADTPGHAGTSNLRRGPRRALIPAAASPADHVPNWAATSRARG